MRAGHSRTPSDQGGLGGLWFSVVLLALAALLFIARAIGPDEDGDGMSNAYERFLGLDPHSRASSAGFAPAPDGSER